MNEENCIFCNIIKGEIPSYKIYEDENSFAFLDIQPVTKGHTLIIPKTHVAWMHEAEDGIVANTYISAKKVMNLLIEKMPCDYVQITVVGKDVPHFHVHLIPRHFNDGFIPWPTHNIDPKEAEEVLAKIKK